MSKDTRPVSEQLLGDRLLLDGNDNIHFFHITDVVLKEDANGYIIETILAKTTLEPEYTFGDKSYYQISYGAGVRMVKLGTPSAHTFLKYICEGEEYLVEALRNDKA